MTSALHQEAAAALARLRQEQERIERTRREVAAATHSATAPDRSVEASVDSGGQLLSITLRGTAYRTLAPAEFADRVAQTVRAAQHAAAEQATAILARHMPPGMREMLAGGFDLGRIFEAAVEAGDAPLFADEAAVRPGGERGER
jgi:YbaB/EbfC DNA-binding family protein